MSVTSVMSVMKGKRGRAILLLGLGLGLVLGLGGCGKSGSDKGDGDVELKDEASAYAGLAFTTVDQGLSSSALSFADFATGETKSLSTGESGDPLLAWLGGLAGKLWLFNRAATRLNFRSVDPRGAEAALSSEVATQSAKTGDPHAALLLDESRLLLGYNTAGKVLVVDPATGKTAQDVGAKLAVGSDDAPQLRPVAFWTRRGAGDATEIWVLNQGLDANYALDGSQALYLLLDSGGDAEITADSLGAAVDGLASGLPLTLSNPVAFLGAGADTAYVVGICYPGQEGCHQGVELFDAKKRTSKVVYDADDAGFFGNGAVADAGGGAFFLQAVKGDAKLVIKVDTTGKSFSEVHTYPAESNGCCSLTYDQSSDSLYVGDRHADGTGEYQIYRGASPTPTLVELPGIPYQGVLVPK
jgi:hypothetical protein